MRFLYADDSPVSERFPQTKQKEVFLKSFSPHFKNAYLGGFYTTFPPSQEYNRGFSRFSSSNDRSSPGQKAGRGRLLRLAPHDMGFVCYVRLSPFLFNEDKSNKQQLSSLLVNHSSHILTSPDITLFLTTKETILLYSSITPTGWNPYKTPCWSDRFL